MNLAEILRAAGWTEADMRHARRYAEIEELGGGHDDLMAEIIKLQRQTEMAASRTVLARLRFARAAASGDEPTVVRGKGLE